MRLISVGLLALVLLAGSSNGQCPKTLTKVKNLFTSILTDASMNSIINILVQYIKKDLTLQQSIDTEYNCTIVEKRSDCLVNKLIAGVPAKLYLSLLMTGTSTFSCVTGTGYSIEQAQKEILPAILKIVNPVYNKGRDKIRPLVKNKKPDANIANQGCAYFNSAITKPLCQKLIDTAKAKLTVKPVYDCIMKALPTVANPQYKQYKW